MNTPTKPIQNKFVPSPSIKRLLNSPNYSILSASPQIGKRAIDWDLNVDDSINTSINNANPLEQNEEDAPDLIEKLRNWRHDAFLQHLYTTAQFWADKCLHLTNHPNDAFWLAQIYYNTHSYLRAEQLLTNPFNWKGENVRLFQVSLICKSLLAQCHLRLGKWHEALELLGDNNPFKGQPNHGNDIACSDGGIKIESTMCHLRGLIHLHLNSTDKAKEAFMEALSLDVKNYDAFVKLVGGSMMTDEEEWEFVQGLHYKEQIDDDSDVLKLLYTTQLKKTAAHATQINDSRNELCLDDYGFKDNADVMQSQADTLYSELKFDECFEKTKHILKHHPSHPSTLPLHIACMQHLPHLRSTLFLLSHQLVETLPESAISWYAVGVYYYLGKQYQESRRYFSKSSLMDPRFQPAWIAFGHAFAMEGEHDSAITAYSTSSRLFPGTHLSLLYIAMQHIQLANNNLAMNFLQGSLSICAHDPLIYHEMGVVSYYNMDYERAVTYFDKTLALIATTNKSRRGDRSSDATWNATHLGLGQAYRRMKQYALSKAHLLESLQMDQNCTSTLTTLGMVHNELGEIEEAIEVYHKSLSILPGDAMTTELLKLAVNCNMQTTSADHFRRLPEAWAVNESQSQSQSQSQANAQSHSQMHKSNTQHTISMMDDSSILSQSNSNIDITRNEDEESMVIE